MNKLIESVVINKDLTWYRNIIIPKILENKARYQAVADALGCPLGFIPSIHVRESGSDVGVFQSYLGNGQPYRKVTTIVPIGRGPFDTWEEGAIDALKIQSIDKIKEWDLDKVLYEWERYNGFGYRSRGLNSPYVWGYTNHYSKGQFVKDGVFDPSAVDGNIGCYALYKLLCDADPDFVINEGSGIVSEEKSVLEKIFEFISEFIQSLFKNGLKDDEYSYVDRIPVFGDQGADVVTLQKALNVKGFSLDVDGDFGPKTRSAVSAFQKSKGSAGSGKIGPNTMEWLKLKVNDKDPSVKPTDSSAPWFHEAKKYSGKVETDPGFNKFMSSKWSIVGLDLKTISTSWSAWCGLFVAVALAGVGYKWQIDGATAKNWDKFGNKIEWKTNGFPQGAIIRINHGSDCKSASGNHVTMANGWCTAQDLLKSGATFSGYGGNQGNMAKVSSYPVKKICSVSWPKDQPIPGKVKESIDCSNGKSSDESTR